MKGFGVYALVFRTENGERIYIGSTTQSFAKRKSHHLSDLRHGKHHSSHAQRLWNKYQSFEFRILEECTDKTIVAAREQYHISIANPKTLINFGPALPAPFFGRQHSQQTREKMSKVAKGRKSPLSMNKIIEIIANLAKINKGRPAWNKGRSLTTEQRKKISDGFSAEDKEKIALGRRGKAPWNKGLSVPHDGKPHTEETRKLLSDLKKGNTIRQGSTHTEEAKEKMRLAWEKRRKRKSDNG